MRIHRFTASKVHGYLSFDVRFDKQLSFLTGINGSGKTSVIQSIVALISPDFWVLSNLSFAHLQVDIEHNNRRIWIRAEHSDSAGTEVTTSDTETTLLIEPFDQDSLAGSAPYRRSEREFEYYSSLEARYARHPVMTLISELPTPMFLDLDRRVRAIDERRYRYSPSRSRASRNIFSQSLSESLQATTGLAEQSYRDALIEVGFLGESLRRSMILDLLELEPSRYGFELDTPNAAELDTLTEIRDSLAQLPDILQIPEEQIQQKLIPTLNTLESYAREIPRKTKPSQILQKASVDDPRVSALIGWSSNRPQLKKLVKMVDKVQQYNKERADKLERTNAYLDVLNAFLTDSGKTLFFDDRGYLWFFIKDAGENRHPMSFSSGEGQLFVILTHLFFNPLAHENNVFIVDEPELSLHVQWQELFVDSVVSANDGIQYIMATHSPSIILDRVNNCRDLSPSY